MGSCYAALMSARIGKTNALYKAHANTGQTVMYVKPDTAPGVPQGPGQCEDDEGCVCAGRTDAHVLRSENAWRGPVRPSSLGRGA